MARALVIGPVACERIAALLRRAAAEPVAHETLEALVAGDLVPAEDHNARFTIEIPEGFRVTFTFEHQPGGLCRHMSVSVTNARGRLPHPAVVAALMREFGFHADGLGPEPAPGRALGWLEETLGTGGSAINVVEPVDGDWSPFRREG